MRQIDLNFALQCGILLADINGNNRDIGEEDKTLFLLAWFYICKQSQTTTASFAVFASRRVSYCNRCDKILWKL